jgi:hypothetical protein
LGYFRWYNKRTAKRITEFLASRLDPGEQISAILPSAYVGASMAKMIEEAEVAAFTLGDANSNRAVQPCALVVTTQRVLGLSMRNRHPTTIATQAERDEVTVTHWAPHFWAMTNKLVLTAPAGPLEVRATLARKEAQSVVDALRPSTPK